MRTIGMVGTRTKPRQTRAGPGPSRFDYRVQRIAKRLARYRLVFFVFAIAVIGTAMLRMDAFAPLRSAISAEARAIAGAMMTRPEFYVAGVRITGASDALAVRIRAEAAGAIAASSMEIDLADLKAHLVDFGAISDARLRLDPGGWLSIDVDERVAVLLWRDIDGQLWQIDESGVRIAEVAARRDHQDLRLVLGAAAPEAAREALEIFAALSSLQPRLRGLRRMNGRRWDVLLGQSTTLMLPATDAVAALDRVRAWHIADGLLDRDIAAVDMRLPTRPTVRMTAKGFETFRVDRASDGLEGEDT